MAPTTSGIKVQIKYKLLDAKCLLLHCKVPPQWKLQVYTSHMFMLNTEQGLASKLLVMSQITLIGPPLKLRLSVSTENIYTFRNECENTLKCQTLHIQ